MNMRVLFLAVFVFSTVAFADSITVPANTTVGLGLSTTFPVTLSAPAPAGGVTVLLTSSDPSKVTLFLAAPPGFAALTIHIGPGATTPTIQPQVYGAGIGSATITASAPGYTGGSGLVTVVPIVALTLTKTFGAASIDIGVTTTLSFTLSNPAANVIPLTGLAFTDTLPAGLIVSTPNGLTGSCGGGTITAVAGSNSISLAGATLAAGASCTFSVNVTSISAGVQTNTTSTVTSNQAPAGTPATAAITVLPVISASGIYQLRYLANLDKGDSYVNLTNAGTLSGFDPAGRICVNVYTFDPAEELISCCACPVTPNGLNSLSARNDLISNTLTPGVPTSITVKLVASLPVPGGTCNPSSPNPANLVRGMRAWATTLHLNTSGSPAVGYQHTETPFTNAELSLSELGKLTAFCGFIQSNGSGFGICKSCRFGALGSEQK